MGTRCDDWRKLQVMAFMAMVQLLNQRVLDGLSSFGDEGTLVDVNHIVN